MVPRKAGWDTHGLPVELEVEKLLGLDGKDQIEEYGLEPFIDKCKESVWKYKGMWEDFSGTVGFWADMDDPYVTYHNSFIESEWWALKQIWDKGLLYKGFKIVPYCPRCGTPLSAQEVAQGYKDVKERSAIVRFKVKEEDACNSFCKKCFSCSRRSFQQNAFRNTSAYLHIFFRRFQKIDDLRKFFFLFL